MVRATHPTTPRPKRQRVSSTRPRDAARAAHESAKKAQALIRLGLYAPRRAITAKTKFTPRQEKYIAEKFRKLQSHGKFIAGRGTVRPMMRTKRGYVLTPYFRKDNRKLKNAGADIIQTRNGSIVPRSLGKITKHKDGSVTFHTRVFGKERAVRSGTLSPNQAVAFLNNVLDGNFKFPKDTMIRMRIFDSSPIDSLSIDDLRKWSAKYSATILKSADKGLSAITLDYVSLK